jgi:hypothetical protein
MSFYKLTICCDPGGCRHHNEYIFDNIDDIKNALLNEIKDRFIYLFSWYGCYINLEAYNENEDVFYEYDMKKIIQILINKMILVSYYDDDIQYYSPEGKQYIYDDNEFKDHTLYQLKQMLCYVTSMIDNREIRLLHNSEKNNILLINHNITNFREILYNGLRNWYVSNLDHIQSVEFDKDYIEHIYEEVDINSDTNRKSENRWIFQSNCKKYQLFEIFIDYDKMNIPNLSGRLLDRTNENYGFQSYE